MFASSSASRRQDGLQLATILAVAVAVITPAQALFDDRLALIVGAAGLAIGLASQALQAVERRRRSKATREAALAQLLASWPLPAARETDPYDLGVGPPLGAVLAPLALLMPVAAIPALVCGGVLVWRRQIVGGVALIAAATVFAAGGIGLVAALSEPAPPPPPPAGLTDAQALSRYFSDRYAACLRGAAPEYPACGIVLTPASQREWATRNGYWACRATASPETCAVRLP